MDLVDDRALLDGYRQGTPAALQAVFDGFAPKVAAWLTRGFRYQSRGDQRRFDGFRSAADVHDTLHEVFSRTFDERARTAYSGLRPFEGYLFVITRNVVLTRLGKNSADLAPPEHLETLPSLDDSPEESFAREEERQRVREFLETLDADEVRFAELRFVEQRAQVDVAKELGITRKKVRLIETKIRCALARHLMRARGSLEITEAAHELPR